MLFDRLESSISRILKYSSVKVESNGIDLLKGMYDDETYHQKMEKAVGEREKTLEICKEMEDEVAIIIRELYQNRHI